MDFRSYASELLFKAKHLMISTVTGRFRKFDLAVGTDGEDFTKIVSAKRLLICIPLIQIMNKRIIIYDQMIFLMPISFSSWCLLLKDMKETVPKENYMVTLQ